MLATRSSSSSTHRGLTAFLITAISSPSSLKFTFEMSVITVYRSWRFSCRKPWLPDNVWDVTRPVLNPGISELEYIRKFQLITNAPNKSWSVLFSWIERTLCGNIEQHIPWLYRLQIFSLWETIVIVVMTMSKPMLCSSLHNYSCCAHRCSSCFANKRYTLSTQRLRERVK